MWHLNLLPKSTKLNEMTNTFHILVFRLWLFLLDHLILIMAATKVSQRKGNGKCKVERKRYEQWLIYLILLTFKLFQVNASFLLQRKEALKFTMVMKDLIFNLDGHKTIFKFLFDEVYWAGHLLGRKLLAAYSSYLH